MKRNLILMLFFLSLAMISFTPEIYAQEEEAKKPKKEKKEKGGDETEEDSDVDESVKLLKSWSITLGGGIVHPYTDISYKDFWGGKSASGVSEHQFGGFLGVNKMFSGAFGVQLRGSYSKVRGTVDTKIENLARLRYVKAHVLPAGSYVRNESPTGIYFESTVLQGNANIYWNISNTVFGLNRIKRALRKGEELKERKLSVYAMLGIGFASYDAKVFDNTSDAELNVDSVLYQGGAPGKDKPVSLVVPASLGLKYKASKTIDIGLEYTYHYLADDILDNFADTEGKGLNDAYSMLALAVTIKLGGKKNDKESIEWVNPSETMVADVADMKDKIEEMSKDSDDDGVSDFFDKDDETPAGAKVNGDGIAVDSDGDGVSDHLDAQPFSGKGAVVDENGAEMDTDGDGVPDSRDLEPNTAPGTLVNFEGINIGEEMGVEELVQNVGASVGGSGWPSVFFDFNSSRLKREYKLQLFSLAEAMLKNTAMKVKIIGNTDVRGTESYNNDLGQKRADAVKSYMVDNFGIDAGRMTAESRGKQNPTSKIHDVNRRCDIAPLSGN